MNPNIQFPVIVISSSFVDKMDYKYLVADKRHISEAFRNVLIVDVNGNCFETERIVQSGGVSLFYSIKFMGYMVKVKPVLKQPVHRMSISDLKDKLITVITKNPKKFSALLPKELLIKQVKACISYSEIIKIF